MTGMGYQRRVVDSVPRFFLGNRRQLRIQKHSRECTFSGVPESVATGVRRLFHRRGLLDDSGEDGEDSALDAAQGAALLGGVVFGPRAAKRVRRLGTGIARPRRPRPLLCAEVQGFDVHAGIAIAAHDRLGLERLARYGLRASFALSRLARAAHGRLTYEPKHPLDDGTTSPRLRAAGVAGEARGAGPSAGTPRALQWRSRAVLLAA
jgi:hypothetical protein